MKQSDTKRDTGIDLLRVVLMLYIVGYWHMFNYTNPFPLYNNFMSDMFTRSALAVLTLISGFYAAKGCRIDNFNIWNFYKKKIIRIYPLYLFSLFLFLLLKMIGFSQAFYSILSFSMFKEPAPFTLWFVTMIMVFYMLTPFIIKILFRWGLYTLFTISGIFFILLLGYEFSTELLDIRIIMYFPAYLCGVIMARNNTIQYNTIQYNTIRKIVYILTFLSICIIILFLFFTNVKDKNLIGLIKTPFITLTAFILFKWAKSSNIKSQILKHYTIWISYSTWCMYLFHRPIYKLLMYVYRPETLIWQVLYLIIIGLPIIIIASYIIQYIYDIILCKK